MTERPKVMRIITRLNVGGPAIQAILLTRELGSFGYSATLVTGMCEASEGDMSYLLGDEDPVKWIPEMSRSVSLSTNVRALTRIWHLIRREKPDIVHTHTAMAGCLGRFAAILAGVPIIVHTFHGNSLSGYFSRPAEIIFRVIERILARFTDAICVICDQQLSELHDRFQLAPRSRFHVVPLGLDLSSFESMSAPALGEGPLKVGWFGRLVPVKNIPLLLQIIEAALQKTSALEFHIAGDGSERHLMAAAAERFGSRLTWYGWQKDITPIVEKCHVLIQTSRNEGTPVALIQGMAGGRPFISTAVGGLTDMVASPVWRIDKGCLWYSNGILVEPQPIAFLTALLELAGNSQVLSQMGQQARLFAAARYPKQALVATLDALYRELLRKKLLLREEQHLILHSLSSKKTTTT